MSICDAKACSALNLYTWEGEGGPKLVKPFEEEFGVEIPDDAAETILTVGDAVKFLEKNAKS